MSATRNDHYPHNSYETPLSAKNGISEMLGRLDGKIGSDRICRVREILSVN
jgi:hypothetical protein